MAGIFLLASLFIEMIADIRKQSISLVRQIVVLVIGVVINIVGGYQSWLSLVGGVLVGGAMYLYAYGTNQGIGYGDCLIFISAGIYLGFVKNIELLFGSLLLCAFAGGIYAVIRHKGMHCRIPFVPCIFCTYVFILVQQYAQEGGLA